MDHAEAAKNNYIIGYTCAQSVVLAFSDVTGLDREKALLITSSFGAGMGMLREVCGAVNGMMMVMGLLYGYTDPLQIIEKSEHYARVQQIAELFRNENGSMICREILGLAEDGSYLPDVRDGEYHKRRPCAEICASAARIIDRYMEDDPYYNTEKQKGENYELRTSALQHKGLHAEGYGGLD